MNLDYLRTFLEVIRRGSFSEVAKKLSISQPAVSFQIHRLERDLGVRLVDRRRKTITVTAAGKRLLRFAELVEREREILIRDIERLREEVTGDLVIAASTIPGEFLLSAVLSEFKARHPAIGIQVEISDSLTVVAGVRNGNYEVGFCGVMPEGKDLESFKMADDEIVLIVPPEHPFAHCKEVTFDELAEEPLIYREESSGTRRSLEALLAKSGFDPGQYKPKLILSTSQAVVSTVEAGIGIAFVSSLAIKKSLALGLVKVVKVEKLRLVRDFFCIYRKQRMVSRLLSEFVAFVQAVAVSSR